MDNKQNKIQKSSVGEKIRFHRKKSDMTQDELAKKLNITRQALSNWERDINTPDINTLQKLSYIFGIQMDDLVTEVMKMNTIEKNAEDIETSKKSFNKYDMAIGLFYAVAFFMGVGIFFTVGFIVMTPIGWAASLFAGVCTFLALGLLAHAIITLKRKDR